MGEEQAENVLNIKLMKILEEELAAVKFRDRNEVQDENLKDILQCENEKAGNIFKEEVFSPTGNTANLLQQACSYQLNEMKIENNEDTDDLPNEIIEERMIKQEAIDEEGRYVPIEEIVNPLIGNAEEEVLEQSHAYEYVKAETDEVPKSAEEMEKETKENHHKEEIIAKNEVSLTDNNSIESKTVRPSFGSENGYINYEDIFYPPPYHVAEKIMIQAELYFEDYNLFKNSFLLNHVRRNKEGYVSLKLVSSFRKVKALARDWRDVAYSLRKSKMLEINSEKNKIRRIEPIPKIEDTRFGKSVMVFNLPVHNLSREYLKELFEKFGSVVSANIFEANLLNSDAYHKRCLYFHREISSKIYGIVEFERYDYAVNALRDEEGHLPKENEMLVVPLMPQVYKNNRRNLRLPNQYNPNARRRYGRFRPRNGGRYFERTISSSDIVRSGKMNPMGYNVQRGSFRRPYRGRKEFMPVASQKYADRQTGYDFNGTRNNKWAENRRLKSNNNLNIDSFHENTYRKKPGNAYM